MNYTIKFKELLWEHLVPPPCANITMSYIECLVLKVMQDYCTREKLNPKEYLPMIYTRLLDDIFIIFPNTIAYNLFKALWLRHAPKSIALEYSTGSSVNYLDITVTKIGALLSVSLFQKPNNKFLYTPFNTNQPPHIPTNWIRSEIIRPKLFCTDENNFIIARTALYTRLLARGYPNSKLDPIFELPIPSRTILVFKMLQRTRNVNVSSIPYINQYYWNYSSNTPYIPHLLVNYGINSPIGSYYQPYVNKLLNIPLIFKIPYTTRTERLSIRNCITSSTPEINDIIKLLNNGKSPTLCLTKCTSLSAIITPSNIRTNQLSADEIHNLLGIGKN